MKSGQSWAARVAKNHQPFILEQSSSERRAPTGPSGHRGAVARLTMAICMVALLEALSSAQTSTPLLFEVSNPKHLALPADEANRIYSSACELVARSIRPEKPPRLAPKFVLVLGTDADETLRSGPTAEIHLREWNAARFAEAMVLMATREILKGEDIMNLTRDTLLAAQASVSVSELKRQK